MHKPTKWNCTWEHNVYLGLGNYQIRQEYCDQMQSAEEMVLIPAIPVDEIVSKVRSEVEANAEKSLHLENSPV